MNRKRTAIALTATAGVAALAFGGTAVSTAFVSSDNGTASVSTAKIGTTAPLALSMTNALPGDTTSQQWVVTNTGSTPANEIATVVGGNQDNPTIDQYIDVNVSGQDLGTLYSLEQGSGTPLVGPNEGSVFAAGESRVYTVTLTLLNSTPSSLANATTNAVITTTGTAQH